MGNPRTSETNSGVGSIDKTRPTEIHRSGRVGLWHEAYPVAHGAHHPIYINMPETRLGKVAGVKRVSPETRPKRLRHAA